MSHYAASVALANSYFPVRGASLMKRVAVFGNAGGGKSTLAQRVAELTGVPLYVVDKMQFRAGGAKVPHDEFLQAHAHILRRDEWIIDGFGNVATAWERFAAADTLIYVDLPLLTHYRWVTKRFIKGLVASPEGWPESSPLWSSTLSSYRVIPLCHRQLTPKYRQIVADAAASKRVHHLRSRAQMQSFLEAIKNEILRH
jgi:adenylate kinase family enzyme